MEVSSRDDPGIIKQVHENAQMEGCSQHEKNSDIQGNAV